MTEDELRYYERYFGADQHGRLLEDLEDDARQAVMLLTHEVRRLRSLVERLTVEQPFVTSAEWSVTNCHWCEAYEHDEHKPDCPWLEARDFKKNQAT